MDPKIKQLTEKMAAYIEATQPLIDSQNEQRSAFVKRATQVAGVLAHRGIMDQKRIDAFVDKVASDPSAVWDVVEKLAASLGSYTLGAVSGEKVAAGVVSTDPWERRFFGDQSDAQSSGSIE